MNATQQPLKWNTPPQANGKVPPEPSLVAEDPSLLADISPLALLGLLAGSVALLVLIIALLWPKPSCVPAGTLLGTITQQEQAANWSVAADNSLTALSTKNLCQGDKSLLAHKYVTDRLEAVFAQPWNPRDLVAAESTLKAYRAVQAVAATYHVAMPSPLQIAGRAYQSGEFLLAKAALEDAYRTRQFDPDTDRQTMLTYVSSIYTAGYWLAAVGIGTTRNLGLRYLSLAHHVGVCYAVGSGQAFAALERFVGQDQNRWPAPAASPLLSTARCSGGSHE